MAGRVRSKDVKQEPKVLLMLDSGAFSAWSKGQEIDIDDYIQYIEDHKDLLHTYVSLDVIPGKPGHKRTMAMAEEAAAASFENYKYMRKHRLDPMPVVHYGEGYKWIDEYIAAGATYIGLSPSSGLISKGGSIEWLDGVFTKLTNRQGIPLIKTHGFAVASWDLMKRYPWTTCDATSWALTAAFGGIYIPVYKAGKPDYSLAPIKISVSHYEDRDKTPKDHYTHFGPLMKERVRTFLEKEVGVTLDACASDYEARAQAVVFFLLKFQEAIGEQPFQHRLAGFTNGKAKR